MKKCGKCGENKDLEEFYDMKKGTHSWCKSCCKEANNKRYNREQWRKYYVDRREHYSTYQAEYYKRNKKRIDKRVGDYIKDRRELYNERREDFAENHPEVLSAYKLVEVARRKGTLVYPDSCEVCSKTGRVDLHHITYCRPLEGVFLCRSCHKKVHSRVYPDLEIKVRKVFDHKYPEDTLDLGD